jgi:hypothetical protein
LELTKGNEPPAPVNEAVVNRLLAKPYA